MLLKRVLTSIQDKETRVRAKAVRILGAVVEVYPKILGEVCFHVLFIVLCKQKVNSTASNMLRKPYKLDFEIVPFLSAKLH